VRAERVLAADWEVADSPPDACADAAAAADLRWRPARVGPGGGLTAAGALGETSADPVASPLRDYDAEDWWFRVRVAEPAAAPGEELALGLRGLATIAEVYVDGHRVLDSDSMYAAHVVDVGGGIEHLVICARALGPRLAGSRRPRARWRTRVVAAPNLRFFRTMLLGRAPGFAAGPAVVGPWRGVTVERRAGVVCDALSLRPRVERGHGVVSVRGTVRELGDRGRPPVITVSAAGVITQFAVDDEGRFAGELAVGEIALWWPHTHGDPVLHRVSVSAGDEVLGERSVGFRTLEAAAQLADKGPSLRVNGVELFCRGAVWTPLSLADPHGDEASLRAVLELAVGAGLNMLRIPGTACYESAVFHELCDELGVLVWQDLMFANLDYPESLPEFMDAVAVEVRAELAKLAGRPSLAVVCGGSEVAQQVAMLGLDPTLAEGPLYGELLPSLVAEAEIDAPYLPSAPWGGALPFRTDRGVANYFGVGAYLRDLGDVRRAEVRFASECLAFANVGDGPPPGDGAVLGADWKAGVPRDVGAGWDFDDVRDHYLRELFAVDPVALRSADPERYLALSREVSGELMAETFGEWRRAGSPCRGGLVLWLKDLREGAGWGLLDAGGRPKVALGHLRRVLAPVAVWTTDEGLGGIAVHLANDRPHPLSATLRVAVYRDGTLRVEEARRPVTLPAHGALTVGVEELLGRFVDVSWAYRFGPPAGDVVAVSLEDEHGHALSQAFRFPVGRPLAVRSAAELGLVARVAPDGEDRARLSIAATRLAYGVRVDAPGWRAGDDAFCIEPGHPRELVLSRHRGADPGAPRGRVTALNLGGSVAVAVAD
jgi:beta-mannosidase